jgi:hypothetical protein
VPEKNPVNNQHNNITIPTHQYIDCYWINPSTCQRTTNQHIDAPTQLHTDTSTGEQINDQQTNASNIKKSTLQHINDQRTDKHTNTMSSRYQHININHQHINASTHHHINTSTHQQINTSTHQHSHQYINTSTHQHIDNYQYITHQHSCTVINT